MNYVSVVFIGALLFIALLWWCGKRRTFIGPVLEGLNGHEEVSSLSPDEPSHLGEMTTKQIS